MNSPLPTKILFVVKPSENAVELVVESGMAEIHVISSREIVVPAVLVAGDTYTVHFSNTDEEIDDFRTD